MYFLCGWGRDSAAPRRAKRRVLHVPPPAAAAMGSWPAPVVLGLPDQWASTSVAARVPNIGRGRLLFVGECADMAGPRGWRWRHFG